MCLFICLVWVSFVYLCDLFAVFFSGVRPGIVLFYQQHIFLCLSMYKSEINIQSENLKYVHAINVHFKLYLRNEQTRQIHMNDLNVGPALSNSVQ